MLKKKKRTNKKIEAKVAAVSTVVITKSKSMLFH